MTETVERASRAALSLPRVAEKSSEMKTVAVPLSRDLLEFVDSVAESSKQGRAQVMRAAVACFMQAAKNGEIEWRQ